jgi:hypothetical protein
MIVGFSASQGQGKSTVLSSLTESGYKVLGAQTSRNILKEWGLSLAEIDEEPKLREKFQEEIISRHFNTIAPFLEGPEIYLVERTFADIFTYALLSMGSYNEYNSWMNDYFSRCAEYQANFSKVFFITGLEKSKLEDDGVRSINEHFSTVVENTIRHYLTEMSSQNLTQVIDVNTPSHSARLEIIFNKLDELKYE